MNKYLQLIVYIAAVCFSLTAFAESTPTKPVQIEAHLTFTNSSTSAIRVVPPRGVTFTLNPSIDPNTTISNTPPLETTLTPKTKTEDVHFVFFPLRAGPVGNKPPKCDFHLTYDSTKTSESNPQRAYSFKLSYTTDMPCSGTCSGGTWTTDPYICKVIIGQ